MTEHEWRGAEALHERRDRLRATLSRIGDPGHSGGRWRTVPSQNFSVVSLHSTEYADVLPLRKRGVVMPLEI